MYNQEDSYQVTEKEFSLLGMFPLSPFPCVFFAYQLSHLLCVFLASCSRILIVLFSHISCLIRVPSFISHSHVICAPNLLVLRVSFASYSHSRFLIRVLIFSCSCPLHISYILGCYSRRLTCVLFAQLVPYSTLFSSSQGLLRILFEPVLVFFASYRSFFASHSRPVLVLFALSYSPHFSCHTRNYKCPKRQQTTRINQNCGQHSAPQA